MTILSASLFPSLYQNIDWDHLSINALPIIIANVINILLAVIVVLAVIYTIYAGIQYIISSGDPGKTAAAKTGLTNAVIGVILSSSAFLLVAFVAGQFSS